MKTILATISLCLCINCSCYSGLLSGVFPDELELEMRSETHLFSKDQISFKPKGKHQGVWIVNGTYDLEVNYAASTSKLMVRKPIVWQGQPLVFDLPDGAHGITRVRLVARVNLSDGAPSFLRIRKEVTIPKDVTAKEFLSDKYFEGVSGLKIDTTWSVK